MVTGPALLQINRGPLRTAVKGPTLLQINRGPALGMQLSLALLEIYKYSHRGTLRTAVMVGLVAGNAENLRTRTVKSPTLMQVKQRNPYDSG